VARSAGRLRMITAGHRAPNRCEKNHHEHTAVQYGAHSSACCPLHYAMLDYAALTSIVEPFVRAVDVIAGYHFAV
jgi:hypothetical protein